METKRVLPVMIMNITYDIYLSGSWLSTNTPFQWSSSHRHFYSNLWLCMKPVRRTLWIQSLWASFTHTFRYTLPPLDKGIATTIVLEKRMYSAVAEWAPTGQTTCHTWATTKVWSLARVCRRGKIICLKPDVGNNMVLGKVGPTIIDGCSYPTRTLEFFQSFVLLPLTTQA